MKALKCPTLGFFTRLHVYKAVTENLKVQHTHCTCSVQVFYVNGKGSSTGYSRSAVQNGRRVLRTSKSCSNFWKKPSQKNPWVENLVNIAFKLLFVWSWKTADTHTHTNTRSEYCNARAHARRALIRLHTTTIKLLDASLKGRLHAKIIFYFIGCSWTLGWVLFTRIFLDFLVQ